MPKPAKKTPRRPTRKAGKRVGKPVEQVTEEAQFVFRGTVQQRGAATLDQVPLTRDTLIVRVDELLKTPEVLAGFAGADITVALEKGQRAEAGKTYVFYTRGWLYGAGLAVRAMAVTPESMADTRRTNMALEHEPARALQARARRADLVVTGRVREVRDPGRPAHVPITEHDPEWRQAVIDVHSVEQPGGSGAGSSKKRKPSQLVIRFAGSHDVRWAEAPKFAVGQGGVWMLGDKAAKKEQQVMRTAAGAAKTEYVVVDPEDFYPAETVETVRALLTK
jgi:hypothetical protein